MKIWIFALLCSAMVLSARSAQAQWSDPVCADPNSITASFTDMDLSTSPKCTSLCKSVGALCKALIRDAASCNQTSWRGYWSLFGHVNCDTQATSQDRHSCNVEVNGMESEVHGEINSDRDSSLSMCEDDVAACIVNCTAMPVSK